MSYINKLSLAREFRNRPTKAEEKLWKVIRQDQIFGYRFRRQYVIAGFILDFYCPKLKLGIEIDGRIHDRANIKTYDIERENIIKQYNIRIIRFTNEEVDNNITGIIDEIKSFIKNLQK